MTTSDASNALAEVLVQGALAAFRSHKAWADKAIAQLPEDKMHVALDPNTNCIAVIMKHVAGESAAPVRRTVLFGSSKS